MNTSSEFFNDIITVAIVIVLAKFMTYHNRHGLAGAEFETDPNTWIHVAAAAAMAGGVIILLVDVLADDWRRVR
jgi:hypothetical protein